MEIQRYSTMSKRLMDKKLQRKWSQIKKTSF